MSESRVLGPEMQAEGWRAMGDSDWLIWIHPPSHRVVTVEGPIRWESCRRIPAVPEAPASEEAEGFLVSCTKNDENGEPYEGDVFWIESYGMAIRYARAVRRAVLADRATPSATQLALFELATAERT